jgi:hypothetical protein
MNSGDETMQVTMLGIQGSGKTSFMAGLHEMLVNNGVAGFNISTKSVSDVLIPEAIASQTNEKAKTAVHRALVEGRFDQIAFAQRRDFPAGTTQTTRWTFDLLYHGRFVCNFQWIDYRGGIITSPSGGDDFYSNEATQNQLYDLFDHILDSQALILCIDAYKLTCYKTIAETKSMSGATLLSRILRNYRDSHSNSDLTFVIALTKVDSIDPKWKENDFNPLMTRTKEVFDDVIANCLSQSSLWTGGIIAVSSVGEGKVKTTIQGDPDNSFKNPIVVQTELLNFPEPTNVAHTLFYCVGETLLKQRKKALESIQDIDKRIDEILTSNSIWKDIGAVIAGKKTARERIKYLVERERAEYKNLREFEPHIEPLYLTAVQKLRVIK